MYAKLSMVMKRKLGLNIQHELPVLPGGNNCKPQGVSCSEITDLHGAVEERCNA